MNTFYLMKRLVIFLSLFVCAVFSATEERFPWRRLMRGDVVLYCHEKDLKNGERILSTVEASGPQIMADLDLASPDSLTLFLAGSRDEFQQLTRGEVPEWSSGAADPQRSVLYLQSPRFADPDTDLDQVVTHELAHAFLGMAISGAIVDRWFEEGFAMMESREAGFGGTLLLMRGFVFDEALRLAEIEDVLEFNRDKASLAYQESLAAVKYLIERFGTDAVPVLVSALRRGEAMDSAMRQATGVSHTRFQAEWFDAMKRKYRTALALDFSLLLSVVFVSLFAAALAATRIRVRKKKKEWEQQTEIDLEDHEANSTSN